MSIHFSKIDVSNYLECIDLSVDESQKHFVAPNVFSLAQATYEPDMYPLSVYDDDKMVGFILYDYDREIGGWSMSRFMIDKKYQKNGLGSQALKSFIEYITKKHDISALYTSAEVDNPVAIALYEKMGFLRQEEFEYEAGGHCYREVRMLLQIKA